MNGAPVRLRDKDGYRSFLESKVRFARFDGFDIAGEDLHPILLPHQRDIISWAVPMGVRRLMPAETEILQGFPPGYTLVPMVRRDASGKLVDKWREIDADEFEHLSIFGAVMERRADGRWFTTAMADGPRVHVPWKLHVRRRDRMARPPHPIRDGECCLK